MNSKFLLCLALVLSGLAINSRADETNAVPTKPEMVMSLGINCKTNTQTVALGSTNSLKELAPTVAGNFEEFVRSATNRVPTNVVKALSNMAAVMKTNTVSLLTGSGTSEMQAAVQFLSELKKQGRLPGVAKDQHGELNISSPPLSWLQEATYPFALTFHLVLEGDSSTNHYTVGRSAHDAPWQLEKAWRTDIQGHTVKEWPVNWIPDLEPTRAEAEQGDVQAQANLGMMYLNGDRVEQNFTEAVKWLRRAARQGNVSSEYNLGVCYDEGKGVPQDHSKAIAWYRKAAAGHSAMAMVNLGVMYLHGQGVARDGAKALTWLRRAADAGMPLACDYIGLMYIRGDGVTANTNEAMKWYRKAAEEGSAWAQTELGVRYSHGDGVESNDVEAVKWYQKAAEQGDARAEANLGKCYLNGWGVATNTDEAVKWLTLAANQGNGLAEMNLGICFILGRGVNKDPAQAYKWLTLAADQGEPKAAQARDYLSRSISPETIAEGFRHAQAFVPHPKIFPNEPKDLP